MIQGGSAFEMIHGLGVVRRLAQAVVIVQPHVIMKRGFIPVFGRAGCGVADCAQTVNDSISKMLIF